MKINKGEFLELFGDEGYSLWELEHLFYVVCKMDRKVRHWVIQWLMGKGYPKERLEGMSVGELVEKQGMKPLNAFIVMDWLIKDPEAAKYSLTRSHMGITIDDETRQQLMEAIKKRGEVLEESQPLEAEQSEESIEDEENEL